MKNCLLMCTKNGGTEQCICDQIKEDENIVIHETKEETEINILELNNAFKQRGLYDEDQIQ